MEVSQQDMLSLQHEGSARCSNGLLFVFPMLPLRRNTTKHYLRVIAILLEYGSRSGSQCLW